jgi:hypothetical protein
MYTGMVKQTEFLEEGNGRWKQTGDEQRYVTICERRKKNVSELLFRGVLGAGVTDKEGDLRGGNFDTYRHRQQKVLTRNLIFFMKPLGAGSGILARSIRQWQFRVQRRTTFPRKWKERIQLEGSWKVQISSEISQTWVEKVL